MRSDPAHAPALSAPSSPRPAHALSVPGVPFAHSSCLRLDATGVARMKDGARARPGPLASGAEGYSAAVGYPEVTGYRESLGYWKPLLGGGEPVYEVGGELAYPDIGGEPM